MAKWEPLMYRPELSAEWTVQEQIDSATKSYTTFVRWGKSHLNGNSEKFYIVFSEFKPGVETFLFSVKGSQGIKPKNSLEKFKSLKEADFWIKNLIKETDKWLESNDKSSN